MSPGVPYLGITHNARISTLKGEGHAIQSYAEPDRTVLLDLNSFPLPNRGVLNISARDARIVAKLLTLAADETATIR